MIMVSYDYGLWYICVRTLVSVNAEDARQDSLKKRKQSCFNFFVK